jgi:hypothetical protein
MRCGGLASVLLGAMGLVWASEAYAVREIIWTQKASMSVPRNTQTVEVSGTIYCISGWSYATFTEDPTVEAYYPATNTWAVRASKPLPRSGLAIAAVGTKIFACGGNTGLNCNGENEEYDTAANGWTGKASMPFCLNYATAVSLNGKVYVMGGINGGCKPTVEEYDPAGNSWAYMTDMPTARLCLSAVALNGLIYTFGGGNPSASDPVAVVEVFDPVGNTWTSRANMPKARTDPGVVVLNGKIYLIGGYTYPVDVDEYDPVTDTWTICTPIPIGRRGSIAVVVGGKIYAVGGDGGGTVLEGYLPPPPPPPFVLHARDGRIVIAPNRLNRMKYARGVEIAFKGEPGKLVELWIHDATGKQIAYYRVSADYSGEGRIVFDGRDKDANDLPTGLYWVKAKGGGVNDKKGFAVVRK